MLSIQQPLDALVGEGIVWDNHACMPLRVGDETFLPRLEKVRAAGVHLITLNASFGERDTELAVSMLTTFRNWIQAHSDAYRLVHKPEDIRTAKSTGRLGICFDIEGMDALNGEIRNVSILYSLGVRWMLATYNLPNAAGGGCLAEDAGLTAFGRSVIAEMNRCGMVVCASHCGYRTAQEMIDESADPVIFSHSNPRAVWDHPRNIPDTLMRACARRGGVIGINGFGPFLGANDASVERYATHIEYALDVVGEAHVGIGLDYVFDQAELDSCINSDPRTFPPALYAQGAKMLAPWDLPEVARVLAGRGHSIKTLANVFGGNHIRIAETVWR